MADTRLVYSDTEGGNCPACGRARRKCRCQNQEQQRPASDGVIRVGRESKGRKGSGVTTVRGVPLSGNELKALARELKQKCGSGGTLRDGVIEVQGEHRDLLVDLLKERGWTVKKSGG